MARSKIREDQVLDNDFLSETEFATASGVINSKVLKNTTYVETQIIEGGTGTVGNVYYLTTTDDTWLYADKNSEATISGRLGICLENNTIVRSGLVTSVSHGLGVNSLPLYVNTSGTITASIPNLAGGFIKQIGFIEDANTISVQIDENYYELGDVLDAPTNLASQSEAESGTDNTKWMSPLRVWQTITEFVVGVYALVSNKLEHGTITTSATLNAATATEHTGDFTDSWTLTLAGFTDVRPTLWFAFTVSGGSAPDIILAGYSINWPADVSETLTGLVDGDHEVVFIWNATTGEVTARAQKVDA